MVFFRLLVNSFVFAVAEASPDSLQLFELHAQGQVHGQADIEGLHLLQTSAHAQVSRHNSSSTCDSAKDALKAARRAKNTECADEPKDYVEPPEGMTALDKYKIFPPPEEDDLSSLKSCKEGWMAHTTQMFHQQQCWYKAVSSGAFDELKGPLGTYRVTQSESNHITPSACLELIWKISRQTGLCNPNATSRRENLPANYQFKGCTAEFWDQSSSDVLTVPEHLVEETKFNNLRGQTKYGACMLCGQGVLGDGNRVYGYGNNYDNVKIGMGKAGIIRRDSFAPITRMSCILNPEEKDGFEIAHVK